jgi:hypothetical protein
MVDGAKLATHIKLCRRNLKSDRVKCCGSCPFEDIIVSFDPELHPLFVAKKAACYGYARREKGK